ncbi:LPS export ABC transporter periplasmic protein LptC [Hydrogenophaga sp.]|uniref:LPS export ABC transporter periplasmic protein LptC n=1 Tax=Hydrogenophaga sp. TaxID=1904254 RepID=UPI00263017E1|nr:LPS export ABC transporter periplasmic protein LptC [Hydrogenophaga sp.]MDM7951577.1 LPS export ABC transporter periplasmic protein LptC [Hydrogenophaga sp.]
MSTALPAPPSLPAGKRRSRWRPDRLVDRLSIYLPVLLMGLLALASYWLLRATPGVPEAVVPAAVTSEPDYFMRRFSVKVFDPSGNLKNEVFGSEARHRPDSETLEIDDARIRSIGEDGLLTTATAQRVLSNAAQTEFVLEGDAVVVREAGRAADGSTVPRLEFRGELLRVYTDPQRLVSERPVTLLRGKDRLQGDTLDYRADDNLALLRGRVKVQLSGR